MEVIRLTSEHKQVYIDFVAAHPSGSFLQSWSWGDFQSDSGKGVVRYGVFDAGTLLATVQLIITKIPRLPGHYLYAPYGPLLSLATENQKVVLDSLLTQIKSDHSKAWFIRIEPKDDLQIDGRPSLHIQPGSTLVTDISVTENELLARMHQKNRYNIKVAAKHNVEVKLQASSISKAISLLTGTSKRQGYKSHPDSYYINMLTYFERAGLDCKISLYQAFLDEQCIASAIMIDHGSTRTYLFGGSDNSKKSVMAPYALHWQAIKDAKELGLKTYDWWGTETASGATPGFVQFKLKWGGTQKFYFQTRDVVLNSSWYLAYNALRKVNRLI